VIEEPITDSGKTSHKESKIDKYLNRMKNKSKSNSREINKVYRRIKASNSKSNKSSNEIKREPLKNSIRHIFAKSKDRSISSNLKIPQFEKKVKSDFQMSDNFADKNRRNSNILNNDSTRQIEEMKKLHSKTSTIGAEFKNNFLKKMDGVSKLKSFTPKRIDFSNEHSQKPNSKSGSKRLIGPISPSKTQRIRISKLNDENDIKIHNSEEFDSKSKLISQLKTSAEENMIVRGKANDDKTIHKNNSEKYDNNQNSAINNLKIHPSY